MHRVNKQQGNVRGIGMELFLIAWWTKKDDKVDATTSKKNNCNNNNWWMMGHDGWTTKMTRCIMRWMTKGNYVNDKDIKWKNMQQVLMFQSFYNPPISISSSQVIPLFYHSTSSLIFQHLLLVQTLSLAFEYIWTIA
jgi:hypothetical protein